VSIFIQFAPTVSWKWLHPYTIWSFFLIVRLYIAGTHDLNLAYHTMEDLINKSRISDKIPKKLSDPTPLPRLSTFPMISVDDMLCRYDKSLRSGRGDRSPIELWPQIRGILPHS
jgi:pantothenate kinase-related protein Tda10